MRIEGDYDRDGAVCIRGAFTQAEIASVAKGIDKILAAPSHLAKRCSFADDGAFVEDFCNWQRIPELESFARESCAAGLAGSLMRSRAVRLYHDHVLAKEAGTRQPTPWHQDAPYYNISGNQCTSLWFPVDAVSREATLRIVAGSHKGGLYLPRTFRDGIARWFPPGSLPEMPDRKTLEGERVLAWTLEPGDAIFFDARVIHGAGGADKNCRRRVLSLRFIGDDIRFASRNWVTSPPFEGLSDQIENGEPMHHPLFPVIWCNEDRTAQEIQRLSN